MSNKNQLSCLKKPINTLNSITLPINSSEEEIVQKLKQVPFDMTLKIAVAVGRVWQEVKEN